MKTDVVIVSHGDSGRVMVDTAERIVGQLSAQVVTVPIGESREATAAHIEAVCASLNGEQVLFLVDLEGSTPFNVCSKRRGTSVILSGMNMPMLFKLATTHRDRPALELAEELRSTGQKSIHIRSGAAGTRES